MKKILCLLLIALVFISCEDVISVDLNEAPERLVIEASMIKLKDFTGNNQQIRITKTRGFFEDSVTTVENAIVSITKEDGELFEFEHDSAGIYRTHEFEVETMKSYHLKVEVDNEVYTAEETFATVVKIDSVTQRNNAGFGGEEIELKAYYTDPEGEENFYLFTFFVNFIEFPTTDIFDDEFFDGNTIFALYQEEELEPGDEVSIRNFGMSKQFYEYMFILLSQIGSIGGPFETQPATVRGNIINETNPDHFPYGYFSLSESDQFIYTVQ